MKLSPSLHEGVFLRRYKRFLCDILDDQGREITIHCPNTGSMKNCISGESSCWYSTSSNPKRKYAHTWELATTPAGHLAGINTQRANALVREALENGVITEFSHLAHRIDAEVKVGQSRLDFALGDEGERCYVEVKNVTLGEIDSDGICRGFFPDAQSVRALRHLHELQAMVAQGQRAALIFCVQHSGIVDVAAAEHIHPEYAYELARSRDLGVELVAYKAEMTPSEIVLRESLPLRWD